MLSIPFSCLAKGMVGPVGRLSARLDDMPKTRYASRAVFFGRQLTTYASFSDLAAPALRVRRISGACGPVKESSCKQPWTLPRLRGDAFAASTPRAMVPIRMKKHQIHAIRSAPPFMNSQSWRTRPQILPSDRAYATQTGKIMVLLGGNLPFILRCSIFSPSFRFTRVSYCASSDRCVTGARSTIKAHEYSEYRLDPR